jgi:ribose transport system substrate-binding protein
MNYLTRYQQIVDIVNERGFLSVAELSRLCQVSEMTIRRDLEALDQEKRIRRIYGGATSIHSPTRSIPESDEENVPNSLVERVDAIIATSVNLKVDGALLDRISKKNIPMVAESQAIRDCATLVAVDNYQAGLELGRWAGRYAQQAFGGQAKLMDLTTHLPNSVQRSHGFLAGLREILPDAEILLSMDGQSRADTAYQLTLDALAVHPQLNLIFTINDTIAMGAVQACQEMNVPPERMAIIPFGLEGDAMKDLLVASPSYIKAGMAMFPEIVGPCCIEASIAAYQNSPLPRQLVTPSVILTAETLGNYYQHTASGWKLRWDAANKFLSIPTQLDPAHWPAGTSFPRRIGFVIPFREHEWYQNLSRSMREHASRYHIDYEIVDVEQNLKDEIDQRRRGIAKFAASQVRDNEVIVIDGGPIANYLAENLVSRKGLTIITNSMPVFDILKQSSGNVLILTGGAYRSSSQLLVGPPAEGTLRELRADKLFLMTAGVTLNFGLSHTNISEVTIKQAMIRSAREVILLADTSCFGTDSVIQLAPLNTVQKLITDDALPASIRLDLNKLGIQIILATSE